MQEMGTLAPALHDVPDIARRAGGWILGLGHEAQMLAAAT
jgi:hypothetical protein